MKSSVRKSYVYVIEHIASGRKYIGKTFDLDKRWREHICSANRGVNSKISHAIRKYGSNSFAIRKLFALSSDEDAFMVEQIWIKKLDTIASGLNIAIGGRGGFAGIPKSEDHRKKIGDAHRGRKLSPERIARMRGAKNPILKGMRISAALKGKFAGKPLHPNTRAALLVANTGRVLSQATRSKISASRTGIRASEETKKLLSAQRFGKKRLPFSKKALDNIRIAGEKRRGKCLSKGNLGQRMSEEQKAKLSAIHRSSAATNAQIERLRRINTGSKRSDVARKKISNALKAYWEIKRRVACGKV